MQGILHLHPQFLFYAHALATLTIPIKGLPLLADVEASSRIQQCWMHEDEDLNQSDHFPVSTKLMCNVTTQPSRDSLGLVLIGTKLLSVVHLLLIKQLWETD